MPVSNLPNMCRRVLMPEQRPQIGITNLWPLFWH